MRDVYNAPAILLIGNDPTEQHPLLAWQIRNNVRLHGARFYVVEFAAHQARAPGRQLYARFRWARREAWLAFLGGDDSAAEALVTASASRDALDGLARPASRRAEFGDHFRIGNSRRRIFPPW